MSAFSRSLKKAIDQGFYFYNGRHGANSPLHIVVRYHKGWTVMRCCSCGLEERTDSEDVDSRLDFHEKHKRCPASR